jgi:hypothetical protein
MGLEVILLPQETFVSGHCGVVFKGSDDIEGHLNLHQTLVEVNVRAVGVKPRSSGYDVVFSSASSTLSSVRVLDERWN